MTTKPTVWYLRVFFN